jgi:ABC-type nitrate/sulfonate/bicarbonate transport system substrate-binding protein
MNFKNWKQYAQHYGYGLVASCWNAGISALYAAFGQAAGAAVMKEVPVPTGHEIGAIFVGAAALQALGYFKQHPLPIETIKNETNTSIISST